MTLSLLTAVYIFVLSVLVGFEVISKVPATLHTPLMSGANSIHGVVVIGAMLIAAQAHNAVGYVLAFFAVALGAMNVVGGYVVTDRMLHMFRGKREERSGGPSTPGGPPVPEGPPAAEGPSAPAEAGPASPSGRPE